MAIALLLVWADADQDELLDEDEVRKLAEGVQRSTSLGWGGAFYPGAGFFQGGRLFRPTGLTQTAFPSILGRKTRP